MDKWFAALGLSFFLCGKGMCVIVVSNAQHVVGRVHSSYAELAMILGPDSSPFTVPQLTPQPCGRLCLFCPPSVLLVLGLSLSSRLTLRGRSLLQWYLLLPALGSVRVIHVVTNVYSEFSTCQVQFWVLGAQWQPGPPKVHSLGETMNQLNK